MAAVAYTFMAFGALVCLLNWGTLIASARGKRFVSPVPFVGALSFGWGMSLRAETRSLVWLAPLVDYGTLTVMVALPRLAFDAWSTSGVNLLHRFTSKVAGRTIAIKLFRRNVALISAVFDPAVASDDHGAFHVSFGMVGKWTGTENGFLIEGYDSDRKLRLSRQDGGFTTADSNYPGGKRDNFDSLGGLVMHRH